MYDYPASAPNGAKGPVAMDRTAGTGLIGSGVVIAVVGAILKYAVTLTNTAGFNLNTAGLILLIAGIVLFALGVMIIAVRILLKFAGANPQAGFTSFVDRLSSPFVGPFHPVFADQLFSGHPLELGSLLAMGVYAVLAYVAVRLVRAAFSATRS